MDARYVQEQMGRQQSQFASLLLSLAAWGEISWSRTQQLAQAVVDDATYFGQGVHPSVAKLGKLGTSGSWMQNVRRGGLRMVPIKGFSNPFFKKLPFSHTKELEGPVEIKERAFPLLLPSVIFEDLFRHDKSKFQDMIGYEGGLRAFWNSLRPDDPRLVNHPMCHQPDWKDKFIPLVLHGDGVQFTHRKNSLMVWSMSFLLAPGWSKAITFLMGTFCKVNRVQPVPGVQNRDTYEECWKEFAHSLEGLVEGVHKAVDANGNAYPRGSGAAKYAGQQVCHGFFKACVFCFAYDREYAANETGAPNWAAEYCCQWCCANRSNWNFRDVRPNAAWKARMHVPGPNDRPVSNRRVWTIPGVNRFTHMGDMMHGGDGGANLHLHGSTADYLTRPGGPYPQASRAARVKSFFDDVIISYGLCNEKKKLHTITAEMIDGASDYPYLTIKSNESRHLVKPMLDLLQRKCNPPNLKERHLINAYEQLNRMNEIVDQGPLILTENESSRLLDACDGFLLHYNWLCDKSMHDGDYAFNFTNKFHELWHICHFGKYMNPRATWCYAFEDFVKHIRKVGVQCVCATPMHLVQEKIADNYLRGMSCDLAPHYDGHNVL